MSSAVRSRIGADETPRNCGARRGSLSRDAEVGGVARSVDRKLTKVNAINDRRLTIRSCIGSVVPEFEIVEER